MSRLIRCLVLMGFVVFSRASIGQHTASDRPDTPQAQAFFNRLQQLFKADNRKELAGLIEYPMLTTLNGRKTHIQNRTAFINHFDEIFDKGIRCAILESTDKDVWGNSHGFTIEYGGTIGTVWFDGFRAPNDADYIYRLMTVNNGPLNKCNEH
jgi:hypothetical protein